MDASSAIVHAFPQPATAALIRAFDDLQVAADGNDQQRRALGNLATLPRPWDPAAIVDPQLRYETLLWLDDVVTWFNHEHVWNLNAGCIPPCWPRHPHLVHEIAVIADLRRQAGQALTSQPLEEWHRYAVPAFLERIKQRLHECCDTDHADWPGRSKDARLQAARASRLQAFEADCEGTADNNPYWDEDPGDVDNVALEPHNAPRQFGRSALHLVEPRDPEKGELL